MKQTAKKEEILNVETPNVSEIAILTDTIYSGSFTHGFIGLDMHGEPVKQEKKDQMIISEEKNEIEFANLQYAFHAFLPCEIKDDNGEKIEIPKIGDGEKAVFSIFLIETTHSNDSSISIPLNQIAKRRNITLKGARKLTENLLKALFYTEFVWEEKTIKNEEKIKDPKTGEKTGQARLHVVIDYEINRNIATITYHPKIFELLKQYSVLLYYPEILGINFKHYPHSLHFANKILDNKHQNRGKPNETKISVKALLNASPNMPTVESLRKKAQYRKRIIDPFEKNLDALSPFIKWEYCNAQGVSIADTGDNSDKIDTFLNLYVNLTFLDPKPISK